jgi:GxxExxY protein
MHAEHANPQKLNDLSRQVIGCTLTVLNTLGAVFLEKVYENALAHEVRGAGLLVAQQLGAWVQFKGIWAIHASRSDA